MDSTAVERDLNEGDPMEITGAPLEARPDCTLACDMGHITVHKLVLCVHSKYLQDILSKFPTAEHPIIVLTELNITDIKILVNYMYTGELVITNDSSPSSLLRAAQILKIDSLTADDDEDEEDDIDDQDQDDRDDHLNHQVDRHRGRQQHQQQQLDTSELVRQQHQDLALHHRDMDDDIDADDLDGDPLDCTEIERNHLHHQQHHNQNISNNNNNHHHHNHHQQVVVNNHHRNTMDDVDNEDDVDDDDDDLYLNMNLNQTSQSQSVVDQLRQVQDHHQLPFLDAQDSKHIDSKNNKIRCHLCNIGLSDVKCLYRHVLTRHLPEKWGYKCEFCDREFSRDDHLMRHYTTKHKNMEFNREKIRETRRLNREMAKNFHDQISSA